MPCARRSRGTGSRTTVLACSSAGGGLRLAVVGYERAGHRRGRATGSACRRGAKVVHVACGPTVRRRRRRAAGGSPDVVLLVGGTDGGQRRRAAAQRRSAREGAAGRHRSWSPATPTPRPRWPAPRRAGPPVRRRPPTCCPGSASWRPRRRARRSARPSSPTSSAARGSRAAAGSPRWCAPPRRTPCCAGSRCSPTSRAATCSWSTSAARPPTSTRSIDPAGRGRHASHRDVVGTLWHARTVEGDLGMRWTAEGVVEAAAPRAPPARRRHRRGTPPRSRPTRPPAGTDAEGPPRSPIASTAAVVAVRRHGRPAAPVGRDRARSPRWRWSSAPGECCGTRPATSVTGCSPRVTDDHGGGWRVPERAARRVDAAYVLFAVGLLADGYPEAAAALAAPLAGAR